MKFYKKYRENADLVLVNKDCNKFIDTIPQDKLDLVITSPPYFIGKEYDNSKLIGDFENLHENLFKNLIPKIKEGGSLCWQVGYHINNDSVIPLDYLILKILDNFKDIKLKNRIIWTFGHGLHAKNKFSGRHEIILWFTKGENYTFNLDDVRVPQKYPGKKHYRGEKKGQYSGNPLGKNPSDVWSIPNVKAMHIEKTNHPCQFPISLAERLILSLSHENSLVFDPFMGVGTTGACSILNNRKFIGCELDPNYYKTTIERCKLAYKNELKYREDKPVLIPSKSLSVAQKPASFKF